MNFKKEDLVKSPLNYTGGKFKLLPQILPLFPDEIDMLYDVFGGGGNISVNTKAEHILYNDIIDYVPNFFNSIKAESSQYNISKLLEVQNEYDLSKTNALGFTKLREDYNAGLREWQYFYMLVCHSFNYQIRFNNKQEYNSSFGKDRSYFSKVLADKFVLFNDRLNDIDITFSSKDFREIDFSDADINDLVYLDPPYLISCGVYQDGKRGFSGWTEKDELDLYALCDRLDKQGTRFAMSNIIRNKGNENALLKEWSRKYNVKCIKSSYSNCSYHGKNKDLETLEVLIVNY